MSFGTQKGGGLIERAASALIMVDDEMVIVEANGPAAELFGLDAGGLVAKSLYELSAPEYRRDLRSVSDSLGDGRPQAGQVGLMKSNGDQVGCSFSATPNFNPGVHLWILTPFSQNGSRDGVAAAESSTNGSVPMLGDGSPATAQLTKREAEVLTLLAQGGTNQTIAEQLNLSPETVRSHTRTARLRLGAKSRSHAIALAIESAQIDVAPARNRLP